MASSKEQLAQRTQILSGHLLAEKSGAQMRPLPCLSFSPPEASEKFDFNVHDLRRLLDGHNLEDRDYLFQLMKGSELFNPRRLGSRAFVSPDYNHSMEEQREETMRRIVFLSERGVFDGWLTGSGPERALKTMAQQECLGIFDHSLAIKLGVHFFLWDDGDGML